MEHVELDRGHGVQVALDDFERHEVARAIQHEAAPGEARTVLDVHGRDLEAARAGSDRLQEGLETVHRAGHCGSLHQGAIGGDVQRIGFVLAQRGIGGAGRRAFHAQNGTAGGGPPGGWHGDAGLPREAREETADGGRQSRVGGPGESHAERGADGQRPLGGSEYGRQRHERRRRRGGAGADKAHKEEGWTHP